MRGAGPSSGTQIDLEAQCVRVAGAPKYNLDGTLDETGMGTPMAGMVPGCIGCHDPADTGGDWVFLN